ncbi:hypothetical protein AAZX31_05G218300 [Glycine max]|uniref:Uncharacterized protein n=1 Tax=Glycine max TaxID=3847 RepID=C6TCE2_SOYBN|nr:uncharacterized protein LOC100813100 [Glycine max]KAG5030198.1 hypothetical protein JHK87_013712 [Glycine soja]ACU19494.1 unknown [Glycine max]KAG5041697.1 hypothetical protein JHK85_014173 [Glycine max]KAG5155828.1 hypothetical protein JHK82_013797 [Glycine max]KRH60332.1 hypothetical protein GLYMA_05G233500v4 [Glycine max]|eukprot:NP_001239865.1 uncharacterized protein LOC100813100 [Glycine max]
MDDSHNRKRLRHHSPKHPRLCSNSSDTHPLDSPQFQLSRVDPDLLNMLNDAENVTERDPTMQGLDSVIKSFEEEILSPLPNPNLASEAEVFNPNLGYLLEASDDELGLPPAVAPGEDATNPQTLDSGRVGSDGVDLTGFLGFEDDIVNCGGFGLTGYDDVEGDGGGYVTIDGLFDYAEPGADILWRSESLQAM